MICSLRNKLSHFAFKQNVLKQMTPKPPPMAIITYCLTLTKMTLKPKASPRRPPLLPISRQQRQLSTPLVTCVAHCIWPAVPAAVCPTGRPGGGWWEQTAGTSCITDTTMALETRRRSWVTAAAATTAAVTRRSTDTSRLWPAPSTCTTARKHLTTSQLQTGDHCSLRRFLFACISNIWCFGKLIVCCQIQGHYDRQPGHI